MAWRRTRDNDGLVCWRLHASLGPSELLTVRAILVMRNDGIQIYFYVSKIGFQRDKGCSVSWNYIKIHVLRDLGGKPYR